jgi:probable rRNA maturation factor
VKSTDKKRSMIYLSIDEAFEKSVESALLEQTAAAVLAEQSDGKTVDLTIAIQDDQQLHDLNLQFLGIDAPTDVLSFPAEEMDPETGHLYLGDIIISLPRAASQAESAGHPLQNELQLLVIHGILHLLGHDHATPEMKAEMWQLQSHLLEKLSIAINKLPED